MELSKWYLKHGINEGGYYSKVKEEKTDITVSILWSHTSWEQKEVIRELNSIITEHNNLVKKIKLHLEITSIA